MKKSKPIIAYMFKTTEEGLMTSPCHKIAKHVWDDVILMFKLHYKKMTKKEIRNKLIRDGFSVVKVEVKEVQ